MRISIQKHSLWTALVSWNAVKYNAFDDMASSEAFAPHIPSMSWNAVKFNAFDENFNPGAFALDIACGLERCKIQCFR